MLNRISRIFRRRLSGVEQARLNALYALQRSGYSWEMLRRRGMYDASGVLQVGLLGDDGAEVNTADDPPRPKSAWRELKIAGPRRRKSDFVEP